MAWHSSLLPSGGLGYCAQSRILHADTDGSLAGGKRVDSMGVSLDASVQQSAEHHLWLDTCCERCLKCINSGLLEPGTFMAVPQPPFERKVHHKQAKVQRTAEVQVCAFCIVPACLPQMATSSKRASPHLRGWFACKLHGAHVYVGQALSQKRISRQAARVCRRQSHIGSNLGSQPLQIAQLRGMFGATQGLFSMPIRIGNASSLMRQVADELSASSAHSLLRRVIGVELMHVLGWSSSMWAPDAPPRMRNGTLLPRLVGNVVSAYAISPVLLLGLVVLDCTQETTG